MQINSNILNKNYKKLILQISIHEVSFCLYNTLESKTEFLSDFKLPKTNSFKETENTIIKLIKESTVLKTGFDEVLVLHNNSLNTFIPQSLFSEEQLLAYLQYNIQVYQNDYATYDEINNYEINTVYIPFVALNNALLEIYNSFNYKHSSTILVKKILELSKNQTAPLVYVHLQENTFQVIATNNQKLQLYNTFEYHSEEDFIYHLLFILEQLNFNPENINVKLLGNITQNSHLFTLTYKFIRHVNLLSKPSTINNTLSHENYLKYFTLIHACE